MENSSFSTPSFPYYRYAVVLLFIVPALGGFLFGYDIGATSFAVVQLMHSSSTSGVSYSLATAPVWTGMVVSAPSFGALIGTAVVFVVAESMGRRLELRVGGLLHFVGAIMEMGTAQIPIARFALMFLIVARVIYGTESALPCMLRLHI
jgi:MFS family permease